MAFDVGDLVATAGNGLGYVTASKTRFDKYKKFQYSSGTYYSPSVHIKVDVDTLLIILSVGEKLISDTIIQYEVMLPNGERAWIWGNNLLFLGCSVAL